jgi:Fe-S cluster biogenesis protein NfuA
MNTIVPVNVYAEMTPNPSAMKFVADMEILPMGMYAEFESESQAKGYSSLASALFQFPFVKQVFISPNFVTVIRTDNIEWDFITMELREFIRDYLRSGKPVLEQVPNNKTENSQHSSTSQISFEPSELDEQIQQLLDEYVRPAVEGDGGSIQYRGFKDGVVSVSLSGACAGCPSSTATLKGGIENLIRMHIPEVKEVVAAKLR